MDLNEKKDLITGLSPHFNIFVQLKQTETMDVVKPVKYTILEYVESPNKSWVRSIVLLSP